MAKLLLSSVVVVVLLIGLVLTQVEEESSIQQRFIRASANYYISTESRSFVGAWIDCKTAGMTLASVKNDEEQAELNSTLAKSPSYSSDGYWLGGAMYNNYFYWIDSGFRIISTNWGTYQPRSSSNSQYFNCLRLGNFYKTNQMYKWENVDCNMQLYYICRVQ